MVIRSIPTWLFRKNRKPLDFSYKLSEFRQIVPIRIEMLQCPATPEGWAKLLHACDCGRIWLRRLQSPDGCEPQQRRKTHRRHKIALIKSHQGTQNHTSIQPVHWTKRESIWHISKSDFEARPCDDSHMTLTLRKAKIGKANDGFVGLASSSSLEHRAVLAVHFPAGAKVWARPTYTFNCDAINISSD